MWPEWAEPRSVMADTRHRVAAAPRLFWCVRVKCAGVLACPLTGVVGVGVHVQVGGLLGVMRTPNHTPHLPSLQPHQVGEVGVVLAQGRVERGGRVAFLPLHQGRQQRAAAQAADAGAPGKQARGQAQAAAFLVAPWQPAELPGDEERDGEEDNAAEGDDDGQKADGDLCGRREKEDGLRSGGDAAGGTGAGC